MRLNNYCCIQQLNSTCCGFECRSKYQLSKLPNTLSAFVVVKACWLKKHKEYLKNETKNRICFYEV